MVLCLLGPVLKGIPLLYFGAVLSWHILGITCSGACHPFLLPTESESKFLKLREIYPVYLADGLLIFKEQGNRWSWYSLKEFYFMFNSEGIDCIMLEILVTNISTWKVLSTCSTQSMWFKGWQSHPPRQEAWAAHRWWNFTQVWRVTLGGGSVQFWWKGGFCRWSFPQSISLCCCTVGVWKDQCKF